MIEFHDAQQIILSNASIKATEQVALANAHQRVLASNTYYDLSMPPFDKSAMDGYACRMEDINDELEVIEIIYAGKKPEHHIGPKQCAKIMTGAVVPQGADCVIMHEHTEIVADNKIICPSGKTKPNICYRGEDIQKGDMALPQGSLITSKHLPILAGAGIAQVEVYKQAKVGVFATGTELVEPHEKPLPHQIRNSNSSQTIAQLNEMGITGSYRGIIKDNYSETKEKISEALKDNDVVIMSGGVSEGDFDFIPAVIRDLGFEILLTRSAIQPGKPIIFARKGDKYCFGLAGNPASSYIQFSIYVKPFLYRLSGYKLEDETYKLKLNQDFNRRKSQRLLLLPAHHQFDGNVSLIEYHGSAHINALIHANCLIQVPIGISTLKQGDIVDVRPL